MLVVIPGETAWRATAEAVPSTQHRVRLDKNQASTSDR
jgi:isopenicillin N synthase-like dioxygenase